MKYIAELQSTVKCQSLLAEPGSPDMMVRSENLAGRRSLSKTEAETSSQAIRLFMSSLEMEIMTAARKNTTAVSATTHCIQD